ncbi:hypothetical protein FUAX_36700 [Fulvitalea axinellae]|uniref:CcmD family protein n=1 Tax=Fulvitalea axinellae TaxID=1182444 RepID=A0AAU9CT34_9BACT|nr:hypothetical protein FUAX_36700 [Fulvitalea axinellae]
MKKLSLSLVFAIAAVAGFAQDKIPVKAEDYANYSIEMADQFRADGKIYVVVAVMLVIFAVMAVYLIRLEKKASKIEAGLEELKRIRTEENQAV